MSDSLVISLPGSTLRAAVEAEGALPPGVEVLRWDMDGPAPRADIDLVVPPYMAGGAGLPQLAGMRTQLVQAQSIGYDGLEQILPAGHRLANAASVHETATAELALGLIIAAERGLPDFVRQSSDGLWKPAVHRGLADRRVLLLGTGGVGNAIADRLAPFEVALTRVARTARTDERGPVHAFEELPELLPTADIVVLVVPLSDSTRGLVDAAFLAALPDNALVVNVARGPVVDTDALVAELTAGRLRAALDVTDPEPLPADHPLWSLPNALISPHVGGASGAMMPRMARLIHRQVRHLLAGETPENIVLGG